MKKIFKLTMVLTLAMAMVLSVVACGGSSKSNEPKTLQTFIEENSDEGQQFIDALKQENETLTVEGKVEGNTIIVEGKFVDTYDQTQLDLMVPALDGQVDTITETYSGLKDQIAEAIPEKYGIKAEDITITLIYYNGDGAEMWRKDF